MVRVSDSDIELELPLPNHCAVFEFRLRNDNSIFWQYFGKYGVHEETSDYTGLSSSSPIKSVELQQCPNPAHHRPCQG
jgi:hypothetical protein